MGKLRVGVLAYPGCLGTEVFAVVDLLTIAQRTHAALHPDALERGSATTFDVRVVARATGPVAVSGRCTINAVRWSGGIDLVIVPGFELDPAADLDEVLRNLEPERRYIKTVAAKGCAIASVCVGAFLLGEAGLLDGRRATTSWLFADSLAGRYPTCRVESDQIRVEDGPVTTMAAFRAVDDLTIALVRAHLGDRTSRRRVNKAKELLELGVSCDDAMRTVGYADPAAFRRLFSRESGMPPGAYRGQFHSPRKQGVR